MRGEKKQGRKMSRNNGKKIPEFGKDKNICIKKSQGTTMIYI